MLLFYYFFKWKLLLILIIFVHSSIFFVFQIAYKSTHYVCTNNQLFIMNLLDQQINKDLDHEWLFQSFQNCQTNNVIVTLVWLKGG